MKNIYLCGFMGCGKTTIAKYLNLKTNIPFIDIDSEIEKLKNLSVSEIFIKYNEGYFRKLETKALKKISKKSSYIVSTGGGIFLKKKNVKLSKKTGIIIFLSCPLETCLNRIKNKNSRPLLLSTKEKIYSLFKEREKLYNNIADFKIENNKTKDECVNSILKFLELPTFRFEKNCN